MSGHQAHASPAAAVAPFPAPAPALPAIDPKPKLPTPAADRIDVPSDDTPLIRAIKAFQRHRPDLAVTELKACDPITQQALLSLVPALVRLSDTKLNEIKAEEMDVIVEQLSRVPSMLRQRASLRASNVCLCREVHNFGHVDPFANGHQFRPGDIVYLYMELANFSCPHDPKAGYAITMASALEMSDAAGKVVWRGAEGNPRRGFLAAAGLLPQFPALRAEPAGGRLQAQRKDNRSADRS